MKIRTKLTIKNICVTATVFFACMLTIYIVSEHTRSEAFFYDLKGEAITKAHLFLQNQVDAATMQSIYLNNRQFINEVEVAVYSTDFEMLYHDAVSNDIIKESREMIDHILEKQEIEFYTADFQCVGMVYNFEGNDYIVTAAAYDAAGYNSLHALRRALILLFLAGLALLSVACYLLARASLKPIREIVRKTEQITTNSIDNRLEISNPDDELGELCTTFNDLLARLETAFNAQKQFVSNVSHELRTPLAAVIGQLDLALQKERTPDQYRAAMEASLNDARRITKLVDGLLNLAKADYQRESIRMQEIRLDELLLDVRSTILKAHPDYHIDLVFEQDDATDDRMITVEGNLYLLSIAFSNLIENNCKYSDDRTSFVQISYWESMAIVRFSDAGAGMTDADREKLFTLFYRGENPSVEGHGIGMTLAQKIIALHEGTLSVHTHQGEGTTFLVEMKHV